jgi:hypothetical protein
MEVLKQIEERKVNLKEDQIQHKTKNQQSKKDLENSKKGIKHKINQKLKYPIVDQECKSSSKNSQTVKPICTL